MMNRIKLIERGYFPKELPPCFTTKYYSSKFDEIINDFDAQNTGELSRRLQLINSNTDLTDDEKAENRQIEKKEFNNRKYYSTCCKYNIPKTGLSRNLIKIPNPHHQGRLVISIEKFKDEIKSVYAKSKMSVTIPQEEDEVKQGRRAVRHDDYGVFKEKSILNSFDKSVQLKTDISKFYPSIYTHSIPWATEGSKANYKRNWVLDNKDPRKRENLYGDDLDTLMVNCQNKQTKGIPIGPDTSLIISEIIGCHIDNYIATQLDRKKIKWVGFRYYDDYNFYFTSELDARICLDILDKKLSDFELQINQEKTSLGKVFLSYEKDWSIELRSFYFRQTIEYQREDIWNYFALSFKHARDNLKDSVLKFALNKFNFVRIEKENWDFFEPLLLRVGLLETSTLDKVAKILVTYKKLVSKNKIKAFVQELIERHYKYKHDYEMTWGLWLLKEFKIYAPKAMIEKVLLSQSVTSSIIALDLLSTNKKIKNINLDVVESTLNSSFLNTEKWLLAYEVLFKNWISSKPDTLLDKNFFFKIMKEKGVYFYDENEKIEPLKIQRSLIKIIAKKLNQVEKSITKLKGEDKNIEDKVRNILEQLEVAKEKGNIEKRILQDKLASTEESISGVLEEIAEIREKKETFEKKRLYFALEKRLEELQNLTKREIQNQSKEDLLYNPTYE